MKTTIISFIMIIVFAIHLQAQVAINMDGTQPDNSAMLDVKSSLKGFLPPRMTKIQRNAIVSPVPGLMVFCIDCDGGVVQIFSQGRWRTPTYNSLPTVSYVDLKGFLGEVLGVNQLLLRSYIYSDAENDPEGMSLFQWYRADNEVGLNKVQIAGATDTAYTTTVADLGKYIGYSVAPVSISGDSPGEVVMSGFLGPVTECGLPITDPRDGKVYNTRMIGNKCWMSQNLNVGARINSTANQTDNDKIEKYCYGNTESNCNVYGGLYQWDEMYQYAVPTGNDQGICPPGWHVPGEDDWEDLKQSLLSFIGCDDDDCCIPGYCLIIGGFLKTTGTSYWLTPNTGATNLTGFSALPSGYSAFAFFELGESANFWSDEYGLNPFEANLKKLSYNSSNFEFDQDDKFSGKSVRCVRN
jgi:uncharacterized protein (TIGR02145 family)